MSVRPHPFRDAATELLDAIRVTDSPIGRIDATEDALERLAIAVGRDVGAHWIAHYLGDADEDPVLVEPVRVWDRLRDLATRVERLERPERACRNDARAVVVAALGASRPHPLTPEAADQLIADADDVLAALEAGGYLNLGETP